MHEQRTICVKSDGGDVYECEAFVNLDPLSVDLPDGNIETTIEFARLSDWRLVDEREMLRA